MSSPGPFAEKRSALRTATPIEIVLKCPDKEGKTFIEKTRTLDISRTGARTLTEHAVSDGARLQMAVPHQKKTSWATIARLGNKSGNQQEIGIAIDESGDLWGVQLPEEPPQSVVAEPIPEPPAPRTRASTGAADPSLALVEQLLSSRESGEREHGEPVGGAAAGERTSPQLPAALQEQVGGAIEQSLQNAVQRLNEQAADIMKNLLEVIVRQTEENLRQGVAAAIRQIEGTAVDVTNRSQADWEQRIQALTRSAEEQLRTRLAEHETQLAASATKGRRELVRKLAEISSAVAEE